MVRYDGPVLQVTTTEKARLSVENAKEGLNEKYPTRVPAPALALTCSPISTTTAMRMYWQIRHIFSCFRTFHHSTFLDQPWGWAGGRSEQPVRNFNVHMIIIYYGKIIEIIIYFGENHRHNIPSSTFSFSGRSAPAQAWRYFLGLSARVLGHGGDSFFLFGKCNEKGI